MGSRLLFVRRFFVTSIFVLASIAAFSQTYILNEDFSSASGTTPPEGWSNVAVTGDAEDLWRFDNAGGISVSYPATGKMAILDGHYLSTVSPASDPGKTSEQTPITVSLETKYIDCSISNNILLMFHQWFVPDTSVTKGIVEVWDGTQWHEVAQFTDSTDNVEYKIINVSQYLGGVSDAKVRFKWDGVRKGWWAIDNFKVYAPLSLDASLDNISNPRMPFQSGTQDIKVDISNLGINTLTSLKINWEINGTAQTPFNWTGSLALGEIAEGVKIGSYNFKDGEKVNLRIWVSDPNGRLMVMIRIMN